MTACWGYRRNMWGLCMFGFVAGFNNYYSLPQCCHFIMPSLFAYGIFVHGPALQISIFPWPLWHYAIVWVSGFFKCTLPGGLLDNQADKHGANDTWLKITWQCMCGKVNASIVTPGMHHQLGICKHCSRPRHAVSRLFRFVNQINFTLNIKWTYRATIHAFVNHHHQLYVWFCVYN